MLRETPIRQLDRAETNLGSVLDGRPALVTLWATWCDACRDELPALTKISAWSRQRGARVIGVAVGETLATVERFSSTNHLPYEVFVDEDFRLADALGERRVPTTLVVDRTGRIVFTGGVVDARALAALRATLEVEH